MQETPSDPSNQVCEVIPESDPVTYLARSALFRGVGEPTLRQVEPPPEWTHICAGDSLMRQGEEGADCFFLVRGRLRVSVNDSQGGERMIGYIQAGETVGEMALLTDEPRSANIRAVRDSTFIRFSRNAFLSIIQQEPDAALTVSRTIIQRLKRELAGKPDRTDVATIAVLPVSKAIDGDGFTLRLQKKLAEFSPSIVMEPDTAYASPGFDPEGQKFAEKLYNAERHHRYVLFQCAYGDSQWNRLCLRQADLILAIADARSKPVRDGDTGPVPGLHFDSADREGKGPLLRCGSDHVLARVELVMLHGSRFTPHCGTDAWLQGGMFEDFHHVRRENDSDFGRIARLLTGRGVNVVLGGGGAKGFAQIGVLRAIVEAGIPIDRIAGTSMGSLIAAQYSLGYAFDKMIAVNRKIWVDGRPLSDFTFPAVSIVRGKRLQKALHDLLNPWRIEDMPLRFFCVSSNLSRARLCVHDRGVLWRGVRASGSIPGIGPPMITDGELLIDGGVLNNLPGNLMAERFNGRVIVVDVAAQELPPVSEIYNDSVLSGWYLLWRRLNPLTKPADIPGIMEILQRTVTLSSERLSMNVLDHADFVFSPPVSEFGTLSFDRIEKIVDTGYQYARERLNGFDSGSLFG